MENFKDKKWMLYLIILIWISLFFVGDMFLLVSQAFTEWFNAVSNGEITLWVVYHVIILVIWVLFWFMLFFPNSVSSNLRSPIETYSLIASESLKKIWIEPKGEIKIMHLLYLTVSIFILTLTMVLIHYIFIWTFLWDWVVENLWTTLSKAWIILVMTIYMWYFANIVLFRYFENQEKILSNFKIILFLSIIYLLWITIAIETGKYFTESIYSGIFSIDWYLEN